MDFLNDSVTLVVKAPNQKIADQTVECALGWTIKKLKEHLSSVYPSQPKESQQKLIYSGQLLKDELVLKDVLRQQEEGSHHTVHLVCALNGDPTNGSGQVQQNTTGARTQTSNSSSPSSQNATPSSTPTSMPMTEGLRHRGSFTTPNVPQPGMQQIPVGMPQAQYSQYLAAMMAQYHYNPQQMMMMQQIYAQQLAQYMQYHQQLGPATPPPSPGAIHVPAANQNQPGAAPVAAAVADNRPAGDQPIRMNAQGGAVLDDDDEDGLNRDWLDWVYTMCRFMVLISIVYFYSTLGRFFVVFGFFFLVWMYQNGYFQVRRRVPARAPEPQQQQAQPAQPAPVPQQAPPEPQEGQQGEPPAENTQDTDNNTTAPPPEPPHPGVLTVAFSFITTFFTSLVPQQPDPVNRN